MIFDRAISQSHGALWHSSVFKHYAHHDQYDQLLRGFYATKFQDTSAKSTKQFDLLAESLAHSRAFTG
jgi:hypothetical protein